MRYTTIIDISEMAIYKNANASRVYFHLAMKSGWHDQDRDLIDISLRRLAEKTGLTLSATRNAMKQLEKAMLIQRRAASLWWIRKWVLEETPTPRPKNAREKKNRDAEEERARMIDQRMKELNRQDRERKARFDANDGKSDLMIYIEQLQAKAAQGDAEAAAQAKRYEQTYHKLLEEWKKSKQKQ